MKIGRIGLLAVALGSGWMMPATAQTLSAAQIAQVIASPERSAADRTNDIRRKPADMLAFIGIRGGMVALDVSAAGGYTTELIARAIGTGDGAILLHRMRGKIKAEILALLAHLLGPRPWRHLGGHEYHLRARGAAIAPASARGRWRRALNNAGKRRQRWHATRQVPHRACTRHRTTRANICKSRAFPWAAGPVPSEMYAALTLFRNPKRPRPPEPRPWR